MLLILLCLPLSLAVPLASSSLNALTCVLDALKCNASCLPTADCSTNSTARLVCDAAGNLLRLRLDNMELSGTISTCIGSLVRQAWAGGAARARARARASVTDRFSRAQSKLVFLDLQANKVISGTIPSEIGLLSNLTLMVSRWRNLFAPLLARARARCVTLAGCDENRILVPRLSRRRFQRSCTR